MEVLICFDIQRRHAQFVFYPYQIKKNCFKTSVEFEIFAER